MAQRKLESLSQLPSADRRRTARGEETRRLIVKATVKCLYDLGYAGTSIEAVMEASGMSRGSVLNQFPNRNALMMATIDTCIKGMIADFYHRVHVIEDPFIRLRSICHIYWQTQNLPEGIAMMEILLASRWDKALSLDLKPVEDRIDSEFSRFTTMLSQAAGMPESVSPELHAHARFIVFSTRGIVLELMHDPQRDIIHRTKEHLNDLHQAYCDHLLSAF